MTFDLSKEPVEEEFDVTDVVTTHFMLVNLHTSQPPKQRQLKQAGADIAIAAGADEDSVVAHKKLWQGCGQMEVIEKAISAAAQLHRKLTMPYLDNGGARLLLNSDLIEDGGYIAQMKAAKVHIRQVAQPLVDNYDHLVDRQLDKLQGYGSARDYPSKDEIENWDWLSFSYMPVPKSTDWDRIEGCKMGNYMAQQTKSITEKAAQSAFTTLLKDNADYIKKLANACRPADADGKKGRFYDTHIENIEFAVKQLRKFNMYKDPDVIQLCTDIEQCLLYATPDQVRNNEGVKEHLHEASNAILDKMSGMGWS